MSNEKSSADTVAGEKVWLTRWKGATKDPRSWLRREARAILHYAQFRLEGYAIRSEMYETQDEIVLIIHLPFPKRVVEDIKKYFEIQGEPEKGEEYEKIIRKVFPEEVEAKEGG